jgi:hypothetical protein
MATAASAISSSTFAGQSVIKTQSELSRKVANVDARVSMRRNLKSTPGSQISSSEGGLGDTERRRTGTMATTTTTTTVRAAQNAAAIVSAMSGGTPVRSTSILVVGATGTLGRQVVRRALDEGYDVRCLVRSRPAPADFLRDWGATVFNGDLNKPETLPGALVGIHTVIDCATGRPEEPIRRVDWDGKVALISCAKAMGIQRFVFFSIHNCEKHPEVPLMEIKRCTEKYLVDSGMNFTIIRLCGFMQASFPTNLCKQLCFTVLVLVASFSIFLALPLLLFNGVFR